MRLVGLLGDVHGKYEVLKDIIEKNPDVDRWFQVGDLGGEILSYPSLPSNFHFIQGNHENWDYLENLKKCKDPAFMKNGTLNHFKISDNLCSVAVMGGNYSSKYFKNKVNSLRGVRRKHFTEDDFNDLMDSMRSLDPKAFKVDILLTHEAPSPFVKFTEDIGIRKINDLISVIKPDIHFFGHHHMFKIQDIDGTVSIGLDYIHKSYILYDLDNRQIKRVEL